MADPMANPLTNSLPDPGGPTAGQLSPPPLDKAFMITMWTESFLYGANVILYTAGVFLLSRKRGTSPPLFLIGMMTLMIMLGTSYTIISLQQLLEAFVYLQQGPDVAITYFGDNAQPFAIVKLVIFELLVFTQDLILIWRMWVVWGNNWKLVAALMPLEFAHIACGYVAISFGATDGTLLSDPILKDWTTAYWSLDFVVNTMATSSIVFRLWSAGQSVRGRGNPQNRYLGLIMTLVESGTIYFVMTTVIFILVLTQTATVVPVLDVAAQLAIFNPLLIVVRVGLGLNHSSPSPSAGSSLVPTASSLLRANEAKKTFSNGPLQRLDGSSDDLEI